MSKHFLSCLLISFLLLVSCNIDEDLYFPLVEDQNLLENRLIELYGSTSSLILPDSDNYSLIPMDANNPLTEEKVLLGQMLFHETGLALNPKESFGQGTYSCASCHHARAGFQSGIIQGIGEGGLGFGFDGEGRIANPFYDKDSLDVQPIRTPTVLNTAYQDLMLWNGQFGAKGMNTGTEANWTPETPKEKNNLGFEGLETQAIAGLGVHRLDLDTSIIQNGPYKDLFDQAFSEIPVEDRYTLINAGLAIAAYERTILANQAPFQKFLRQEDHGMSEDQLKGALIFYGKGKCFECHSGPGLNGMDFHALGMHDLSGNSVIGQVDETTKKGRGGFTNKSADNFKFKTPPLYNLRDVSFFGHGGNFNSVREVIEYKNAAKAQNTEVPGTQLSPLFKPLNLTDEEIDQLTLFLENALHDPNLDRYVPEATPLGSCFPNADPQSQIDLGCN